MHPTDGELIAVNRRRTLHRIRTAALAAVLAALAIPAGAQAACLGADEEPSQVALVASERSTF